MAKATLRLPFDNAQGKRSGQKSKNRNAFRKNLSIIAIIAIIIAIFLTAVFSQQQQEVRQQAAQTECLYAFKSLSVCNSYCLGQENKKCLQNLKKQWGCCDLSDTNSQNSQTNLGSSILCSHCSDTYKYCHVSWYSKQNCQDTENARYIRDCSCTQGTIDCKLLGINTSSCP